MTGESPTKPEQPTGGGPLSLLVAPVATRHPLANAASRDLSGPRARSLYIHVPFCFHKCHYCDFYSIVDSKDRQPAFTDRLIAELAAIAPFAAGGLDTIFAGGGTPTLLEPSLWRRLLAAMHDRFGITAETEFTVECNPETATDELMAVLAGGGVNRLSIGAQSFDPRHLKTLERWHDPASVERAIACARRAGIGNVSIDLLYAIPGQSLDDWTEDLRRAHELGTDHLSAYNLMYEPNTAMTKRLERGEFKMADEDLEVDMHHALVAACAGAGLGQYEVSNFARPGLECAHNLAYWRQEPWLAAGPSASGYAGGHRWKNVPRLGDYLDHSDGGLPAVVDHEPPDARRHLGEVLMTGLRLREGVSRSAITKLASDIEPSGSLMRTIEAIWSARLAEGLLIDDGDRVRLNGDGLLMADGIAGDLLEAVLG